MIRPDWPIRLAAFAAMLALIGPVMWWNMGAKEHVRSYSALVLVAATAAAVCIAERWLQL